jgi:hypothetical protein
VGHYSNRLVASSEVTEMSQKQPPSGGRDQKPPEADTPAGVKPSEGQVVPPRRPKLPFAVVPIIEKHEK